MDLPRHARRADLEEAWSWLVSLQPNRIHLGLERVERALEQLGRPQDRLAAVTIAGTNGKGSTAAFLASMAHVAGYRVGLYTSPHIVDVTERIRVGGTHIEPAELARWAFRVREIVAGAPGREPVPLTFFEALTVIALGYFAEREVDLAVLEVGMGGRLDATAVVPPLVAVLTPIGLDHQAFLGDTEEAICREKAGILKPGATVVCDVGTELFRSVVGPRALELRCPIRRAGVDFVPQWLHGGFRYRGWLHRVGPVRLGLAGLHQAQNAALACAAAESLSSHGFRFRAVHMAEGLQRTRHAGRLEHRGPRVDARGRTWPALLLDGAHNPHAAKVLAPQVPSFLPRRPRVLLFSAKPDKDVAGVLAPLAPLVDAVVVTDLPDHGAPPLEPVLAMAHLHGLRVLYEPAPERALESALLLAGTAGGVLVTGSLHLLGEVMPLLPPKSPWTVPPESPHGP